MTRVVDSHCHLHHETLSPEQTQAQIDRAREAGICAMLTVGTSLEDHDRLMPWVKNNTDLYGSVGIHPHHAAQTLQKHRIDDVMSTLESQMKSHPRLVALGETGLDRYYGDEHIKEQKILFQAHLELAEKYDWPVIVHTRSAPEETLSMIQDYRVRGVIHCFGESQEWAQQVLNLQNAFFMISFSGVVTFKNAQVLRAVVPFIPSDRVLIETDAPYLAPVPHRGKVNEPAYVTHTAQVIADLYDISLETVLTWTWNNFRTLFLPHP